VAEPPAFTHLEARERNLTATVDPRFAATLAEGHFPGEPLLPGSAMLDLMVRAARALTDGRDPLAGIAHAVFRRRVDPADRIVVRVRRGAGAAVEATVRANGADAASARLRFEPRS
jgi:3-hydroxymyristoyl/3-hydroxydecanoyl-(acyl carrier protein) dehydratase